MDKRTVAIIFDRFGPYHVARLEAAAGLLHVVAIEVCAMSEEYAWDRIDAAGGFQRKTLFSLAKGDSSRQSPASIRERIEAALHEANRSQSLFQVGRRLRRWRLWAGVSCTNGRQF